MLSYGVILLFFSHLPNVIQICDIMPCTNACCSIQFLLQKLQTLSVLFPPSELLKSPKSPIIAHSEKTFLRGYTVFAKYLNLTPFPPLTDISYHTYAVNRYTCSTFILPSAPLACIYVNQCFLFLHCKIASRRCRHLFHMYI